VTEELVAEARAEDFYMWVVAVEILEGVSGGREVKENKWTVTDLW
jgi:hypothetical protein